MAEPITDLAELLRSMRPTLNPGVYAYISLPHGTGAEPQQPIATFRDPEGLSVIVDERVVAGRPCCSGRRGFLLRSFFEGPGPCLSLSDRASHVSRVARER